MPAFLGIRNAKSGAMCSKSHHCPECGGPIKPSCITKKFHFAFCKHVDPTGRLCGERYRVKSQGCMEHPYNDNNNREMYCFTKKQPYILADWPGENGAPLAKVAINQPAQAVIQLVVPPAVVPKTDEEKEQALEAEMAAYANDYQNWNDKKKFETKDRKNEQMLLKQTKSKTRK